MKMRSPIPHKRARIEIIPLIDIMFFLLASFMMVSLSQTHMKGIRVNLPSPNYVPPPTEKKDFTSIRVDQGGIIYFDNVQVSSDQVLPRLTQLHQANPDVKVSLSADKLALHGDVITVLDQARSVGIQKIGYQIKTASGEPGAGPPPGPPGAPPPPKNP